MRLKCENCKAEILKLEEDDFGSPIDWNTRWEQYLCEDCHDKIWKNLLDNACPVCETHPCEKGRDCWVNPFPRIMYLCYVAPKKKQLSVLNNLYEEGLLRYFKPDPNEV